MPEPSEKRRDVIDPPALRNRAKPAPLDRRRFLSASAAIGSTLGFFTSTGRAQRRVSATDTLVVAVMGVNGQGLTHARNFALQEGAEVAYICDVDERVIPRAIEETAKHQKRKPVGVADFRRVLDDRSVDIISIATPNHWHAPATIMACAAGKHVYVEKPCSYSAEEGELAIQAARKYERVVQMGNQRRSRPLIIEAIKKIHDGVIGNVMLARTWYNNPNFLDSIRNNRRSASDIEGAHQSTLLCHLGNIAQRTGRPLQTDPSNGHILGDTEAEQLWGREEYREGFDPKVYV